MARQEGKYQFTAFELGQIKAHLYHEVKPAEIQRIVYKSDGISQFSIQAIHDAKAKFEADPNWRGERLGKSGPQRKTTKADDKKLVSLVYKERGKRKVTTKFLKKRVGAFKKLTRQTVAKRLKEHGLKYLPRRKHALVAKKYVAERKAFARFALKQTDAKLRKWAFTDGTSFFLARDDSEHESAKRRALGQMMWRMSATDDGTYEDTLGACKYRKAQGQRVVVWGLLAEGKLYTRVLGKGESMNRWWYAWIIENHFPSWLGSCTKIVQDYEGCLWCDEPLKAMADIGVSVVEEYPTASQDLNPIENVWGLLKGRLDDTMPDEIEDRDAFIKRLRVGVDWLNRNCKEELEYLEGTMKERCQEVLEKKGLRTGW